MRRRTVLRWVHCAGYRRNTRPNIAAAPCASWRARPAARIDPHINYTLQYWQLYQSIYDGLVNFKKAAGAEGFTKVPDLAEEFPAPTNDGKTYVFKIRKGIKFSNGQELGVKDVVASFQRIFKVSSPTAGGFYAVIVGADKCLADAETCTLEGGVVGDEAAGTVTINLTRPDAEFFYKLAVPHAVDPAGRCADQGCRHQAAARHRRLHDRDL